MRCAVPLILHAYEDATASALVEVEVVALLPPSGPCTGAQLVAMTSAEFSQHTASPFNLDPAEAAPIAGAVLGVWAVGFGIRSAIRALRSSPDERDD